MLIFDYKGISANSDYLYQKITVLDCNIIEIEGTRTANDTKNNFLIIEPLIVGELLTKNGKN